MRLQNTNVLKGTVGRILADIDHIPIEYYTRIVYYLVKSGNKNLTRDLFSDILVRISANHSHLEEKNLAQLLHQVLTYKPDRMDALAYSRTIHEVARTCKGR
jgi:hypothetical protein